MDSIFGKLKRKVFGSSDINLPDEKKGKPVRSMSGGMTKGGEPDDARFIEHNKRKSDQVLKRLTGWGKAINDFNDRRKKK